MLDASWSEGFSMVLPLFALEGFCVYALNLTINNYALKY